MVALIHSFIHSFQSSNAGPHHTPSSPLSDISRLNIQIVKSPLTGLAHQVVLSLKMQILPACFPSQRCLQRRLRQAPPSTPSAPAPRWRMLTPGSWALYSPQKPLPHGNPFAEPLPITCISH